MFERRLRLFLILVVGVAVLLLLRAGQLQIAQSSHWRELADRHSEQRAMLPALRGRLLDRKGRELARDEPAYNLAVDYRVIPIAPDPDWLVGEARRQARLLDAWADRELRGELIDQQKPRVLAQLRSMWDQVARATGRSRQQIDEVRAGIVDDVRRKQKRIWELNYRRAAAAYAGRAPTPWWQRLFVSDRPAPRPEEFFRPIWEETQAHVIVAGIDADAFARLKLIEDDVPHALHNEDVLPVLVLQQGHRRVYPYGDVACHVIGRLGEVSREDLAADPRKDDELLAYRPGDLVGRDGLEQLAEHDLRGRRGQVRRDRNDRLLGIDDPQPGSDVRSTIDIELQQQVQMAFSQVEFKNPAPDDSVENLPMNGAAVVIDVPTNQVLALVSLPTYDLNRWNELGPRLLEDELNYPLTNRALRSAVEPGSTVKPLIGLAAITQGLMPTDGKIGCNGYPVIDGRQRQGPRCWTMSIHNLTHRDIPWQDPHPTGELAFAEAIKRSCNVFFITLGDKLGVRGMSYWYSRFGLGRSTGIGLPESRGLVPGRARIAPDQLRSESWYAAIGQGRVAATPIQLANIAATLARDGLWMRPVLTQSRPSAVGGRPTDSDYGGSEAGLRAADSSPERLNLQRNRQALLDLRRGMIEVVHSDGGTGTRLRRDDLVIAAKTGSASAAMLSRRVRDPQGNVVSTEPIPYGSRAQPNPDLPWYRYTSINRRGQPQGTHSWVMGYAPADQPQVAFAVFVEYGGSGQMAAGSVARRLLDACIAQGYLNTGGAVPPSRTASPATMPSEPFIEGDPE